MKKAIVWIGCAAAAGAGFMAAKLWPLQSEPPVVEDKPKVARAQTIRDAVINGDMRVLLSKARDKKELFQVEEDGSTLLHLAAENGQAHIAYVLMYYGIDPTLRRQDGKTAADLASDNETWLACQYGEDSKAQSQRALLAARQGNEAELIDALRNGADPNIVPTDDEPPMLIAAVKTCSPQTVRELLDAGADVSTLYEDRNVIFAAMQANRDDLIEILVNAGADPLFRAPNGSTPLHGAVWHRFPQVTKALVKYYKDFNVSFYGNPAQFPVTMAVLRGSYEPLKVMLEAGLNPNATFFLRQELPLIIATRLKREMIVELLLQYGADPRRKNRKGECALDIAQGKIAEMLKKAAK